MFIKTHGSELQGQEEAHIFLAYVATTVSYVRIYTDGSSKIWKCCSSATIAVLLTYVINLEHSNWVELTTWRWNNSAQSFLSTSQPEIIHAHFRDYTQNSTNINVTIYLLYY